MPPCFHRSGNLCRFPGFSGGVAVVGAVGGVGNPWRHQAAARFSKSLWERPGPKVRRLFQRAVGSRWETQRVFHGVSMALAGTAPSIARAAVLDSPFHDEAPGSAFRWGKNGFLHGWSAGGVHAPCFPGRAGLGHSLGSVLRRVPSGNTSARTSQPR